MSLLLATALASSLALAQTSERPLPPGVGTTSAQSQAVPQASPPMQAASAPGLGSVLSQIEQAAQATNIDLSQLRIEKWKTDNDTKQQARSNTQSLQRNLTAALPTLVTQARTSPNDLTTLFRLYRNIGALYDVLANVTEATAAFGSKQEGQALASHVDQFDAARRDLGDLIESTSQRQSAELAALRNARATAQQQAAATPKKIIVDDQEPAPKKKASTRKKKTAATKPTTAPASPQ